MSRVFAMPVARVYPLYVEKLERKGRTRDELDEVIHWLTGFDGRALQHHLAAGTTFEEFFAAARLNPAASLITGVICGMRVEQIEDPLMQQIRYLDKLVDELSAGTPMEKVLRTVTPAEDRERRARAAGIPPAGTDGWNRSRPAL